MKGKQERIRSVYAQIYNSPPGATTHLLFTCLVLLVIPFMSLLVKAIDQPQNGDLYQDTSNIDFLKSDTKRTCLKACEENLRGKLTDYFFGRVKCTNIPISFAETVEKKEKGKVQRLLSDMSDMLLDTLPPLQDHEAFHFPSSTTSLLGNVPALKSDRIYNIEKLKHMCVGFCHLCSLTFRKLEYKPGNPLGASCKCGNSHRSVDSRPLETYARVTWGITTGEGVNLGHEKLSRAKETDVLFYVDSVRFSIWPFESSPSKIEAEPVMIPMYMFAFIPKGMERVIVNCESKSLPHFQVTYRIDGNGLKSRYGQLIVYFSQEKPLGNSLVCLNVATALKTFVEQNIAFGETEKDSSIKFVCNNPDSTSLKIPQKDGKVEVLGSGGLGLVIKAFSGKTKPTPCALKLPGIGLGTSAVSKDIIAEVGFYRYFSHQPGIMQMLSAKCLHNNDVQFTADMLGEQSYSDFVAMPMPKDFCIGMAMELMHFDFKFFSRAILRMCRLFSKEGSNENTDTEKKEKSCVLGIYLPNIASFMLQTLVQVEYIHSRGIIHRDLKPENSLIKLHLEGSRLTRLLELLNVVGKDEKDEHKNEAKELLTEFTKTGKQRFFFESKLNDFGTSRPISPPLDLINENSRQTNILAKDIKTPIMPQRKARTNSVVGTKFFMIDKMNEDNPEYYGFEADMHSLSKYKDYFVNNMNEYLSSKNPATIFEKLLKVKEPVDFQSFALIPLFSQNIGFLLEDLKQLSSLDSVGNFYISSDFVQRLMLANGKKLTTR
eukprot:Nk52_evm3s484 gene=Nk52_evmTU3s484